MYIFKYHPDNVIYRNGSYISSYAEFMVINPTFPLVEGNFLEYGLDKFVTINSQGHDVAANIEDYQSLISAINSLV